MLVLVDAGRVPSGSGRASAVVMNRRVVVALVVLLLAVVTTQPADAKDTMTIRLPKGECRAVYDVVLHLHGHDPLVLDGIEAAGIDAAVIVVNRGLSSADYQRGFATTAMLDSMLRLVRKRDRERGCDGRMGRLALSVWSAGYGGALELLADAPGRFDAFVAMDAPYASYVGRRGSPISPPTLGPFLAYARRAVRGDALMAISHSQIRAPSYPAARETTSAMLRALGVERRKDPLEVAARRTQPVLDAFGGPPPPLKRLSVAEAGGLWVAACEGRDAAAHVAHLTHAPSLGWKRLVERWAAKDDAGRARTPRS